MFLKKITVFISLLFTSFLTLADVEIIKINAPSLLNATIETATEQELYIYLPPSYSSSSKRYPVMYYLHGYGGKAREAGVIANELNNYIKAEKAQGMIIVGINGNNLFGGSFYANSPITGNWRDFVTKDVIRYVDSNYRTLAQAKYRGIFGFSMGGFAAINIAFKHPDIFKHLFSLSPGLFDEKGLDIAANQWKVEGWSAFMNGYAAAFAPQTSHSNWYNWDRNSPSVRTKWESGFGNLTGKVDAYLQESEKLSSIQIEYGSNDRFTWIPDGSRYLVQLLKNKAIEVNEIDHHGGHDLRYPQVDHIINFFSLVFSKVENKSSQKLVNSM